MREKRAMSLFKHGIFCAFLHTQWSSRGASPSSLGTVKYDLQPGRCTYLHVMSPPRRQFIKGMPNYPY